MHILRAIVRSIKEYSYYSIMVDEVTDVIIKEHRLGWWWVCFIGLHNLSAINAKTLAFILKSVVWQWGLDPERSRGQCYDGRSTMMNKKSEVVTTIKNELNKDGLAIHCHAQALNLARGGNTKNCTLIQNAPKTCFEFQNL